MLKLMQHPIHGQTYCYNEREEELLKEHGWQPVIEHVIELVEPKRMGRPPGSLNVKKEDK